MTEYYKTLGIPSDSTLEEVKIAYRKLSKKFHPDVNQGDKYFEERFKEIQEAYEKIVNEKIKENSNFNYTDSTKTKTENKTQPSSDYKKENNKTTSDSPKKYNYSKIIFPALIIILIAIFKPIIQKSIRENAERDLIKTYENPETFEDNYQNSNGNSQSTDLNLTLDSISSLQNVKYDSVVNNNVIEVENKATLNESKQWLLTKLNKYTTEDNHYSEPSVVTFPTKARYYNYYFTIADNNLVVTYSTEFSEIVVDEETKKLFRNTNDSDETIKRLAGKMTVTGNKNFKIIIPIKKIETIYFDEDKDYKGNCDFSISTKKNEMTNYNLTTNDKNYSSYFNFQFDCSQEDNLGKRLNDALFYIKKLIPQTNPSTNEPF